MALERSKILSEYLRQEIEKRNGFLSFADFMEAALYHPQYGYYTAETFTLGRQGDFTTAPEISPLFARCFARPILNLAEQLGHMTILELGAGTGRFACDLLLQLEQEEALPNYYYIYEISETLRKKQQDFLQTHCPHLYSRLVWLDAPPSDFRGIILANEVLDALPVHCFSIQENGVKERGVTQKNHAFAWDVQEPTTPFFKEKVENLRELYDLRAPYFSEINLRLPSFLSPLINGLKQGALLFIDYGYGQAEYYHPERDRGSLTCFYQHSKHDNPLLHPGLQDITAHVDFTRVIDEAWDLGCELMGFTTQAAFLLDCGLMELAQKEEEKLSNIQLFNMHQAVKILTLPMEMGERIKVMGLTKNLPLLSPLGFRLQDRRRDL